MRFFKLGRPFKRYRIEYYRKKLLKHPTFFIDQLSEYTTNHLRRDMKEVRFYPALLDSTCDIKQNKLILILSSDNFFLCNGEAITDNKKVIEYQLKTKDISDHFYKECYSRTSEFETTANDAYTEINSLLAAVKSANSKRFKASQFFNFWHSSLLQDHWQFFECRLDTDDFVLLNYRLQKKKHKNYYFNPCLLFGATKETVYIGLDADENYYYCWLKIGLIIDVSRKQIAVSVDS